MRNSKFGKIFVAIAALAIALLISVASAKADGILWLPWVGGPKVAFSNPHSGQAICLPNGENNFTAVLQMERGFENKVAVFIDGHQMFFYGRVEDPTVEKKLHGVHFWYPKNDQGFPPLREGEVQLGATWPGGSSQIKIQLSLPEQGELCETPD